MEPRRFGGVDQRNPLNLPFCEEGPSMVGFPLLLIPLAIYNIVAWLMPTVSMTDPLIKLTLVSGTEWAINLSDILLALGLLLLLLEVIKGARQPKYLTDHLLSFIVFGGSAAEFVMWPKFGTSTFFLLSLMAMVDFFGGIALRARRAYAPAPVSRRAAREMEPPAPEPRIEPKPAAPAPAATPSAASVAESVLLDHPKPKAAQPAASTADPSPSIPSPELQPGAGAAGAPPQR
jgi:hypothetical protein